MSQENVDLVRGALEAFPRGDLEEMLSYLDPEVEWRSAIVGGAEGNVYRGHEGFRRWFADSFEAVKAEGFLSRAKALVRRAAGVRRSPFRAR